MAFLHRSAATLIAPCLIAFGQIVAAAAQEPQFPVEAEPFIEVFAAAEGLTFSADGALFIGADQGVWRAWPDGRVAKVTDVTTHLGQAGIGSTDILAADFGPTVTLRHGPVGDGVVWRVSPDGRKRPAILGIGDPNAILGRPDGSYLVSDDFTNNIWEVDPGGTVRVFSDAVRHPNGIALSPDGRVLYVAQIFDSITPVVFSDQLWALPLEDGRPAGPPRVVARTGEGGLDGLAMDLLGRVYIADNGGAKVWRYDPSDESLELIAHVPSAASLAFGEGDFDRESLYVTSGFRGGGTIWRIPVGVEGVVQHRVDPGWASSGRPADLLLPAPIVLSMSGDFLTRPIVIEGIEALHHGSYERARERFRQAQEADPEFALAYWGEAMSHYDLLGGTADLEAGDEALRRLDRLAAQALEGRGTPAERALIESARHLFSGNDVAARESGFSEVLEAAATEMPDESEIVAFSALARLRATASDDDEALEAAAELEGLLEWRPKHPGALRYLVHAYESAGLDPLAERARRRYGAVAESQAADGGADP